MDSPLTRRARVSRAVRTPALLAVLTVVFLLALSGVAFADVWTDISDATWQNVYHVSAADASTVADGFLDGTFRPYQAVTRGQFAKMAVSGLGILLRSPLSPSFSDVPAGHIFYPYIEGAVDAGVISGYPGGTYRPDNNIIRQQANSILGLWLSQQEIDAIGGIQGAEGFYGTLAAWFASEGEDALSGFSDRAQVATVHRPGTAYLAMRGVVLGSSSGGAIRLNPLDELTRAQAVTMILRTRDVVFEAELPTVTNVNPATGPAAGGNSVVITGTGFTGLSGAAAVKFGTVNATSYVVNSVTQITAVAPAGTAGTTVDVTVTNSAGTSTASIASKYSYLVLPTVTALNPTGGAIAGNTTVTITGTGFVSGATVAFGGTAATGVVVVNATTITVLSPAHAAGVVDVTVTTPAGTSLTAGTGNDYTYGLPTVTALNPTGQPTTAAGTPVTITGTGFVIGATTVAFGGTAATSVNVTNSTTLTAVSPAHAAGVVDVTVTTSAGTSLTAGTGNDYTYGLPTVTALNPTGQPTTAAGTPVTITGTGFVIGATTVAFGGTAATSVNVTNSTTLTAVSPAHAAGVVDVTVTTSAGTSLTAGTGNDYAYGLATAPTNVLLAQGSATPVGAVTNVGMPAAGATDNTGKVTGWVATSAATIKFTVTNAVGTTSVITINAAPYTSGADYTIAAVGTLTIVVTTSEPGKANAVRTFTVDVTQALATAPTNVLLAQGSATPVGAVTNVGMPAAGATDNTGKVTGWVATSAATIKFTVTNAVGTTSVITINAAPYTSGADYTIAAVGTLTIVVTTSEPGKANAVRTFTVDVTQALATAPTNVLLAQGSATPVGAVTNVGMPAAGATDNTGKVTGWVATSAATIKFTVTNAVGTTSVITINAAPYTSGADYTIAAVGTLTIVVTTSEPGKANAVRTFTVDVTQALATAPTNVLLAQGSATPVGAVTNVGMPAAGATDNTGKVTGWVATSAATIKFTVTNAVGTTSAITINAAPYTSGADVGITAVGTLTIVVTTSETGKANAVRTFTVDVTA